MNIMRSLSIVALITVLQSNAGIYKIKTSYENRPLETEVSGPEKAAYNIINKVIINKIAKTNLNDEEQQKLDNAQNEDLKGAGIFNSNEWIVWSNLETKKIEQKLNDLNLKNITVRVDDITELGNE